ncbi:MAG: DUF89 family protein [Firmicutes bacterium]|nr:DUF89 family protein [Bacillota bacterium]
MKMHDECIPCLVSQVIKTAHLTGAQDRETLYKQVFAYMATLDFNKTNPEVAGDTYAMLKKHIGNDDPYKEVRDYFNNLILQLLPKIRARIEIAADPFKAALQYASAANIIDFSPAHSGELVTTETVTELLDQATTLPFVIDHTKQLQTDLKKAKTLLYLGDNCGEICLDKLLIENIKHQNPDLNIYFGVRGAPVVNDSTEEDAYKVGMNELATIVSNGDISQGSVIEHTSPEFQEIYHKADLVIAKGQANYETLSDRLDQNIYFMLITKCKVIANDIGVPERSLVCLNHPRKEDTAL